MSDWYNRNAESNTSLMPNSREEYEKKLLERKGEQSPMEAQASEPAEESQGSAAQPIVSPADMSAQPQGPDMLGTLGKAGMMSGNPYLMAAGLGLQVVSAGEQNKRNQQQAQRQAYNDRIKARQQAMSQIASMGIQ